MKNKKTFTLMELIIAIVLVTSTIIMLSSIYFFFSNQTMINRERYDMISQVNYAFEDMKVRCISASRIDPDSLFSLSGTSNVDTKNEFMFFGESDIYKITPDNNSDNVWYSYLIDNGNIVVKNNSTDKKEILVNSKYSPTIVFSWYRGYEPNFMTVKITVKGTVKPYIEVSRTEGLRFWFIDVKK